MPEDPFCHTLGIYCKRGNFCVGLICAIVRLSQKISRKNNILYILLWKLHWQRKIYTHM